MAQAPPTQSSPAASRARHLPTDQNFLQVASDLAIEFMKVVTGTAADGWTVVEENLEGVKIEKKKLGTSDVLCFRGTGIIKAPLSMVFKTVADSAIQVELDKEMMSRKVLKTWDDHHEIVYYQYHCPIPCSNRDFLLYEFNKKIKDNHYIAIGRSLLEPNTVSPKNPSFERGEVLCSGYYVRPSESNPSETLMTFVAQVDPCGWLPAILVNMESKNQPLIVAKLRKMIEHPKYTPVTNKFLPDD